MSGLNKEVGLLCLWQDSECLKYFNLSVVPVDANESVKQYAKFVIDMPGGDGAITEFFNLIY